VVRFDTFEAWWEPFTLGVGPAGSYLAGLDEQRRRDVEQACRSALPEPPFSIAATAWTVVARS